jgi:hypothetical protein
MFKLDPFVCHGLKAKPKRMNGGRITPNGKFSIKVTKAIAFNHDPIRRSESI